MMEMFGLVEKHYSSVQGVSMEPGTFNSYPCYRLHKDALVSQPTRYVCVYSVSICEKAYHQAQLKLSKNEKNVLAVTCHLSNQNHNTDQV